MTRTSRVTALRVGLLALAVTTTCFIAPQVTATADTQPCQPIPAPANIRATAEGAMVRFTWDPVPGATEYWTQWDGHPAEWKESVPTSTLVIPEAFDRAATLFQVSALTPCGQSQWSYKIAPSRIPFAPAQAQAFPGKRSMYVTWRPSDPRGNSNLSEVHYKVTTQPGGRGCQVASSSALSCTVTGLTLGKRYTASVVAFNELGTTEPATLARPVRIVVGPSEPTSVEVDTGLTSATVSWKAPTFNGGQPVVRYTATAASSGRSCTTKRLTCQITGLTSGTAYQFVVVADNGRVNGKPGLSFPMSTKTPPTPTATPEPTPEPKPSAPIS